MSGAVVEQLLNGVRVKCADGTEVVCKPMPMRAAKKILDLWERRADLNADPMDRARARVGIVKEFSNAYPELDDHISPGDIEALVPDFFWSATGASVVIPESEQTGTPSGATTSPPGEPSLTQ